MTVLTPEFVNPAPPPNTANVDATPSDGVAGLMLPAVFETELVNPEPLHAARNVRAKTALARPIAPLNLIICNLLKSTYTLLSQLTSTF
jgi:hypothetical protein